MPLHDLRNIQFGSVKTADIMHHCTLPYICDIVLITKCYSYHAVNMSKGVQSLPHPTAQW